MLRYLWLLFSCSVTASDLRLYAPGTPQYGVGGTSDRPAMAVLRGDEDWSWLAEADVAEQKPLDRFKYIPIGQGYLSLGFDGRVRMERFDNGFFGDNPGPDTTWHTRFDPHVSYTVNAQLRFYGALKYANVKDERYPATIVDEQGMDVHQAFVEWSLGQWSGNEIITRVGRQELHYGAGRVISIRNGPNIRRDYDGVMIRTKLNSTIAELIAFKPTRDDAGAFDNATNHQQQLWGIYTSTQRTNQHIDLYYLGERREQSVYAYLSTPVDETRHTLGVRLWQSPSTPGWSYDVEAAYQTGQADNTIVDADINAGFMAGDIDYAFDAVYQPMVSLRLGFSTGGGGVDQDGSARINTYRPLYPSGRYFSDAVTLGPGNVAEVSPSLRLKHADITWTNRVKALWRVDSDDGVYSIAERPLRPPTGNAHFIGTEYSTMIVWQPGPYWALDTYWSHIENGAFLKASNSARTTYFRVNLRLAF